MVKVRPIVLYLAFILALAENGEGAWYVIEQDNILGLHEIEESNSNWEWEMLQILASMKAYETARRFQCDLEIYGRYSLREIPEIRIYVLSTCIPPPGSEIKDMAEYYYGYVFYNIDKHRVYYFGAGESAFATVFSTYLAEHYDKPEIVDLLWLYLNSTSPTERAYYRLDDTLSIDSIYSRFGVLDSSNIFYDYDGYTEDRELMSKAIKPVELKNYPEYSEISFYTWERGKGTIEYYKFKITKSSIEMIEWRKISSGVGPTRY